MRSRLQNIQAKNIVVTLNYHFNETERNDPAISGPLSDRDKDGIVALLEYALARNPNAPDATNLPGSTTVSVEGNEYLAIAFNRPSKPLDLVYAIETTEDFAVWIEEGVMLPSPVDNGDGTELVIFRDTQPIGSSTVKAMRVRVTQQP